MARPEDRLQIHCAMFCTSHVPEPVFWTAVEHGRAHAGTPEQRAREWQRLARKGVKTGLGDMFFFAASYVLAVELKAGANKPTLAQSVFQARMAALGHGYEVVRGVEQLGEKLAQHGIPLVDGWRVKAKLHDLELTAEKPAKPSRPRAASAKPTTRQAKTLARLRASGVMV